MHSYKSIFSQSYDADLNYLLLPYPLRNQYDHIRLFLLSFFGETPYYVCFVRRG